MRAIWNYLGALIFTGLPVWILFFLERISIGDNLVSIIVGIYTILGSTFLGHAFTEWYQRKNHVGIEPMPKLSYNTAWIFVGIASALWSVIVVFNG